MKRVKSREFSKRALQPDARGAVALVDKLASPANAQQRFVQRVWQNSRGNAALIDARAAQSGIMLAGERILARLAIIR